MRTWLVGLFALLWSPVFAQQQTPPIIAFDSIPDPLKLPANLYLGEVSGIAVNSQGHIFVLTRSNTTGPAYAAAAAQLLEFGPDGEYLHEIGHNLYAWSFAHMVKVDRHDNIWVTDKGSDMVIKFTPEASPWCSGANRRPPTRQPDP
jgi:streptogramin lyase